MPRMRKPIDPFTDQKTPNELKRDLAEVNELIGILKPVYDRMYVLDTEHNVWRPAKKFKTRMLYYMLNRFQSPLERLINRLDDMREDIEGEMTKRSIPFSVVSEKNSVRVYKF